MDLAHRGLQADRLHLCQQQGFHAAQPWGVDVFGTEYERVLPARSAANLYPLHYSGKTDLHGFPIGRDRFGGQVIVDLERRGEDKTTGSALILGNSGQGKTFLLKLLLTNLLEYGKSVICLDPENELMELCQSLGGCYVDVMGGAVHINPLEPRIWDTEEPDEGGQVRLGRHISFLRDFFRSYKDFTTQQTDVIELMVSRLYRQWHIRDTRRLAPSDYPVLADLYAVMEEAGQNLNDFLLPGVGELTKPLFAIPTHQFLFHPGSIDKRLLMDHLQLEESEYGCRRHRNWRCCAAAISVCM